MEREVKIESKDFEAEAKLYEKMYFKLFGSITDAIQMIDEKNDISALCKILKQSQIDCEELFICG